MAERIGRVQVQQAEAGRIAETSQLKMALEEAEAAKIAAQRQLQEERQRNAIEESQAPQTVDDGSDVSEVCLSPASCTCRTRECFQTFRSV